MKQVSVSELKNSLSRYLRLVKGGETIEIVERSVPVARLEAIRKEVGTDALMERLLRDGIATRPRRKPGRDLFKAPPVPCKGDAVQALIEERGRY